MYTQDALPFLYGILLKQMKGNLSRSGRFSTKNFKYRDHQGEIARLGAALCMNELETIASLVYFRTLLHNLIYGTISGKSSTMDVGHLQSLKYMAQWLDGNIDVFMSLPDDVAEFKDAIVPVSKPYFLSDRLKERVEKGIQSSCRINNAAVDDNISSRASSFVQRDVATKKDSHTPADGSFNLQMLQMGDDLFDGHASNLTMVAPGSRPFGSSRQMQLG